MLSQIQCDIFSSECGVKTVIVSRTPKLVNRNKPRTILGVKPTDEHMEEALARSKRRNAGKMAKPIGMFDLLFSTCSICPNFSNLIKSCLIVG